MNLSQEKKLLVLERFFSPLLETDVHPYELAPRCVPVLKCISRPSRRVAGWACDRVLPQHWSAQVKRGVGCVCPCRKKENNGKHHTDKGYKTAPQRLRTAPEGTFWTHGVSCCSRGFHLPGSFRKDLVIILCTSDLNYLAVHCKSAKLFFTKLWTITSHSNCPMNSPVCIDNRFQLLLWGTNPAVTGTIDQLSGWKSGRHWYWGHCAGQIQQRKVTAGNYRRIMSGESQWVHALW